MRKAEPTVQAWQADKKSPEKSGFDFFGDFVLAEGLGGGAGQCEKRSQLYNPFSQIKNRVIRAFYEDACCQNGTLYSAVSVL